MEEDREETDRRLALAMELGEGGRTMIAGFAAVGVLLKGFESVEVFVEGVGGYECTPSVEAREA